MEDNKQEVSRNDKDIKRQVSGVVTSKEKNQQSTELKDQELFYRATGNIG